MLYTWRGLTSDDTHFRVFWSFWGKETRFRESGGAGGNLNSHRLERFPKMMHRRRIVVDISAAGTNNGPPTVRIQNLISSPSIMTWCKSWGLALQKWTVDGAKSRVRAQFGKCCPNSVHLKAPRYKSDLFSFNLLRGNRGVEGPLCPCFGTSWALLLTSTTPYCSPNVIGSTALVYIFQRSSSVATS